MTRMGGDPTPCTASGKERASPKGQPAGWDGGEVAGSGLAKRVCAALPRAPLPRREGCAALGMGGGCWSACGVSRAWSHLSSPFSCRSPLWGGHSQSPLPGDRGRLLPSLQSE